MVDLPHKTISQGRKTIAFGLTWYTVDEEISPRKAGTTLAREIPGKHDLIVVRKDGAAQFGLGRTAAGAKAGNISAAAIVADLVGVDSWIYVLEIENSTWICSGRDGYILPAGDRVYETRAAARQAFNDLSPSTFKKVYLPASWKADVAGQEDTEQMARDVEETDVLDFIEYGAPKWGRLSSISSAGAALKLGLGLVLALGLAYGVSAIYASMTAVAPITGLTPEQIAATRARIAEEQNKERLARWAQFDANRPWYQMPSASETLGACLEGIRGMPTNPVGYEVTSFFCDGRNIDGSVTRTTGYTTWLEEWATSYPDLEVATNSTGDEGYISRGIEPQALRGAEELREFNLISRAMMQAGQIEGSRVDLTTPAAARIPAEPDYIPFYAKGSFSITTGRPDAWQDFFSDTPGLAITTVTFSTTDKLYKMEGEIYVPNL